MYSRSFPPPLVCDVLFIVVCLIWIPVVLFQNKAYKNWIKISGKLKDRGWSDRGGTGWSYTYVYLNQEYLGRGSIANPFFRFLVNPKLVNSYQFPKTGDEVTIFVDPKNPEKSYLYRPGDFKDDLRWMLVLIALLVIYNLYWWFTYGRLI